jgi:hypothetical protein
VTTLGRRGFLGALVAVAAAPAVARWREDALAAELDAVNQEMLETLQRLADAFARPLPPVALGACDTCGGAAYVGTRDVLAWPRRIPSTSRSAIFRRPHGKVRLGCAVHPPRPSRQHLRMVTA